MRKNYMYAVFLAVMALAVWLGSYYYTEYRRIEYENGIFVELPKEMIFEDRELAA